MVDATRGTYLGGHNDFYSDANRADRRHNMTSIQARLHAKF